MFARIGLQQPKDNQENVATKRLSLFKLRYTLESAD